MRQPLVSLFHRHAVVQHRRAVKEKHVLIVEGDEPADHLTRQIAYVDQRYLAVGLREKRVYPRYSAFFTMHLFLKKQMAYLRIG